MPIALKAIRAKAVCVCRQGDRILVNAAADTVKGETFYGPLGGGVEFGERAADAIRREMFEEIGVELANVVLIVTAIPSQNFLVMGVQVVMLLVNSYRLHQMLQLVRDVKKSVNSDLSMEWLKPFMTERQCAAGEIMFYKDEKAEDMLYIVSGKFKLVESGIVLPVGAIVGELGMLSPSNMRTQTLECVEAGLVLSVSYSKVEELYVQNPAFGFYFLRLSSARLFQNLETLQQQLNQQTASTAAPKPA